MKPVIVCIAKLESSYIEEWVKYHLHIGFEEIYIYDNEDQPTYEILLLKYSDKVKVIHFPGNNFHKGVQYIALDHFTNTYMRTNDITHVAHIDLDEFIVLKKHSSIQEFIVDYIKDDCAGIGMNWRFFGSSGHTEKTDRPVTERFTFCEKLGNKHIKILFDIRYFNGWNTCHTINPSKGKYIKSTNGTHAHGPFNNEIDFSVIQLNHYKCKTLPEFKYIRSRGRADLAIQESENIETSFKIFDTNEVEELTIYKFYKCLI